MRTLLNPLNSCKCQSLYNLDLSSSVAWPENKQRLLQNEKSFIDCEFIFIVILIYNSKKHRI